MKSNPIYKKLVFFSLLLSLVVPFNNCSGGKFSSQLNSSGQINFSSTNDAASISRFEAAKAVIAKNCLSCHSGTNPVNLNLSTEAAFINAGLVVQGSIQTSKLIYRIQNYPVDTGLGTRSMPPTGPLTSNDFLTLVNWVTQLGQAPPPSQTANCSSEENILAPQIKRLTLNQFKNSITSAFGNLFQSSQYPNFSDSNPRIGLSNDPEILRINEINITSLHDSTKSLVATIIGQNSTVRACVTSTTDACYTTLIQSLGLKLWRRPISTQELADFNTGLATITGATGSSRTNKIEFILSSLIMSQSHLFRTEMGAGTMTMAVVATLTPYEVASLLSFTIWDAPPDDTLYSLAQNNQLQTAAALKAQVTRMTQDSRFLRKMAEFNIDLLKIEDVKSVTKDSSYNFTQADRDALYTSAVNTLTQSFSNPASDLLTPYTNNLFSINNTSAKYFNLNAASFAATYSNQTLDPSQRYGMLSHPAFLSSISGQIGSGIVRRGVFTIEQLLCNELAPAPANVSPVSNLPANFNPDLYSSRELLRITHTGQVSCIGCHSLIDPVGFGFENFGPLGQFRTTEKNNIAIDSSGNISGLTENPLIFNNSINYIQSMTGSEKFKQCLSKKYFHFASGQSTEKLAGRCEFNNFESKIASKPKTTISILESLVELDSFTKRKMRAQ